MGNVGILFGPIEQVLKHFEKTYAKYNVAKKVPKSTVPANIKQQWESIIANEFDTISDDDFLSEITNEWFYLVNQKGIPTHVAQLEDILMTFLAKQQVKDVKTTPKKSPKGKSFLKKIYIIK